MNKKEPIQKLNIKYDYKNKSYMEFLYKDYVFFLKRKKETFDSFILNKNCPLIK